MVNVDRAAEMAMYREAEQQRDAAPPPAKPCLVCGAPTRPNPNGSTLCTSHTEEDLRLKLEQDARARREGMREEQQRD